MYLWGNNCSCVIMDQAPTPGPSGEEVKLGILWSQLGNGLHIKSVMGNQSGPWPYGRVPQLPGD
jgi:hypothetical protein